MTGLKCHQSRPIFHAVMVNGLSISKVMDCDCGFACRGFYCVRAPKIMKGHPGLVTKDFVCSFSIEENGQKMLNDV